MPDTWLGSSPQPSETISGVAGNPAKNPEISQAKTCEHLTYPKIAGQNL